MAKKRAHQTDKRKRRAQREAPQRKEDHAQRKARHTSEDYLRYKEDKKLRAVTEFSQKLEQAERTMTDIISFARSDSFLIGKVEF